MSYTYEYPRPALTVDCAVFGIADSSLELLLIERAEPPFAGHWALPGGFVNIDEEIEDAARRELEEETGMRNVFLEQLFTFGGVGRDPRGRVVSVAYYALAKPSDHQLAAATDAARAAWFPLDDLPPLAFDHDSIIDTAVTRLRGKVRYAPIGFELLPRKFTLTQLQGLYETILGTELDKRNFRKKIRSMELLVDTGEIEKDVPRRPARLYRFDRTRYRKLARQGFAFEL